MENQESVTLSKEEHETQQKEIQDLKAQVEHLKAEPKPANTAGNEKMVEKLKKENDHFRKDLKDLITKVTKNGEEIKTLKSRLAKEEEVQAENESQKAKVYPNSAIYISLDS